MDTWESVGAAKWLAVDPKTGTRYRIEQTGHSQFELTIFRDEARRSFDRKPFSSRQEAARYAAERAEHEHEEITLGRQTTATKVKTPWGRSRSSCDYGHGVVFYSTTESDGYHLSDEANALIPEDLQSPDGWYQDDLDGIKVVLSIPAAFTQLETREARAAAAEAFPDLLYLADGQSNRP